MALLKTFIDSVFKFFNIEIRVFGYKFTFWQFILLDCLVALLCLIIAKLVGGSNDD